MSLKEWELNKGSGMIFERALILEKSNRAVKWPRGYTHHALRVNTSETDANKPQSFRVMTSSISQLSLTIYSSLQLILSPLFFYHWPAKKDQNSPTLSLSKGEFRKRKHYKAAINFIKLDNILKNGPLQGKITCSCCNNTVIYLEHATLERQQHDF